MKIIDILAVVAMVALAIFSLVSFILLIALGNLPVGIGGLVSFILFAIIVYARD